MTTHARLAAVALPLAFTFACTTVRAPASGIDPTVPVRDGVAEPQVELYVEDSGQLDPATLARASDDARRALREALADRHAPAGDAILVVRAQAVSRTAARRADQRAAVAGLVVGAVVIAAVVVLVVASGKGGGGAPKAFVPKSAGHAARGVPVRAARPPPFVPGMVRPQVVRVAMVRPAPAPDVFVSVGPVEPAPPPAEAMELEPAGAPPLADAQGPEPLAAGVVMVTLPPPPPLQLADRGYFARDLLRLELLLVDPLDATVRAVKTVTRTVDVRDGRAVREILVAALDEPAGWSPGADLPASLPSAPGAR